MDPFVTEVDASVSAINPFVTPVSIPDAPFESSPPYTSSISPSQPSSIPSPIPIEPTPYEPVVISDSLDTASFVPFIMQILHQPESPPKLTKL